jgi:hypothetical protein
MIGHPMFFRQARRPALFAVTSAAAVVVAACGSSTPANPTASTSVQASAPSSQAAATTTAPPPAPPKVRAEGTVASVTGSTVAVTAKKGPTTVAITPSTKIAQISPAQFTDVTVGNCVVVRQAAAAPGTPAAPARTITVSAASTGKCPQAISGHGLSGSVTAVTGQSVSVAASAAPPTAVAIDKKTRFLKQASTTALVITQGACLTATGTVDPSGALEATMATVGPPPKGLCAGS